MNGIYTYSKSAHGHTHAHAHMKINYWGFCPLIDSSPVGGVLCWLIDCGTDIAPSAVNQLILQCHQKQEKQFLGPHLNPF